MIDWCVTLLAHRRAEGGTHRVKRAVRTQVALRQAIEAGFRGRLSQHLVRRYSRRMSSVRIKMPAGAEPTMPRL